MFFKTSLAVVSLLTDFLFTGWILNWAPINVMLTSEGYYSDLCTAPDNWLTSKAHPKYTTCDEQQVWISSLWSAVLLAEFTNLPSGVILDYLGPTLFSLCILIVHVGSLVATICLSKNSPILPITFFFMGTAVQSCSLLAMRTVYIFKTSRARKRWLVACCTIFDSSAICTMIYYNLWSVKLISLKLMFWVIAILGGVLFGAQCFFWYGYNKAPSSSEDLVVVLEEFPLLDKTLTCVVGEEIRDENKKVCWSLVDIFCDYKFYFFILLCAVNIYRIRYFLGLAEYTLVYLNDTGTYLQLLGYCFALSVVFAPLADKVLSKMESQFQALHLVNFSITMYFITWLIPNLPLQTVTYALFILARLFTFTVLSEYCSKEFTERRFGLVMGAGFMAASIPGAFMYKIVKVVLEKYNGNFWVFHLMCISMSIPVSFIICIVQRKLEHKTYDIDGLVRAQSDDTKSVSFTPRRNFIES